MDNEKDIDLDSFDDFDEPIKDIDSGERDPSSSVIKKTAKDIVSDITDSPITDQLSEVAESIIPTVVGSDIVSAGEQIKKDITEAAKPVMDTGSSLFSKISELAGEDTFIGRIANKIASTLSTDSDSSYYNSERYNDEIAKEYSDRYFKDRKDFVKTQTMLTGLQAKATSENTRLLLQAKANQFRIERYGVSIAERYYAKSIELKYRHILESKKHTKLLSAIFDGFSTQLQNIEKNTSLPDIVKQKSIEVLEARFKQNIADSIYQSYGLNNNWIQRLSRTIKNKTNNIFTGLQQGFMVAEDLTTGYEMTKDMGSPAPLITSSGRNLLGSFIGTKFNRSKYGRKLKNQLGSFKVSPSGFFKSLEDKTESSFLKWMFGGLSDLTTPEGKITDLEVGIDKLDEATIFDNRTKESINVIPTILGNILNEIRAIRTGVEPEEVKYDHRKHKFTSNKSFKKSIRSDIRAGLETIGTTESMQNLIKELEEESGIKLNEKEKEKLSRRIYKRLGDDDFSLRFIEEDDKLFTGMSKEEKEKYLDMFKKAQTNKKGEYVDNKVDRIDSRLSNIYDKRLDITNRVKDLIKSGYTDELVEAGLIDYDVNTGKYELRNDVIESITATELSKMVNSEIKKRKINKEDDLTRKTAEATEDWIKKGKRKTKAIFKLFTKKVMKTKTAQNIKDGADLVKSGAKSAYEIVKDEIYKQYPDDITKAEKEFKEFEANPLKYLATKGRNILNKDKIDSIKTSVIKMYNDQTSTLKEYKDKALKTSKEFLTDKYIKFKNALKDEGIDISKIEDIERLYDEYSKDKKAFISKYGEDGLRFITKSGIEKYKQTKDKIDKEFKDVKDFTTVKKKTEEDKKKELDNILNMPEKEVKKVIYSKFNKRKAEQEFKKYQLNPKNYIKRNRKIFIQEKESKEKENPLLITLYNIDPKVYKNVKKKDYKTALELLTDLFKNKLISYTDIPKYVNAYNISTQDVIDIYNKFKKDIKSTNTTEEAKEQRSFGSKIFRAVKSMFTSDEKEVEEVKEDKVEEEIKTPLPDITKEELKSIKGIGDKSANSIINAIKSKEVTSIEDLSKVKGVRKDSLTKLQEYLKTKDKGEESFFSKLNVSKSSESKIYNTIEEKQKMEEDSEEIVSMFGKIFTSVKDMFSSVDEIIDNSLQSINEKELLSIKGIGEVKSKDILKAIESGDVKTIDDLKKIDKLKDADINNIKDFLNTKIKIEEKTKNTNSELKVLLDNDITEIQNIGKVKAERIRQSIINGEISYIDELSSIKGLNKNDVSNIKEYIKNKSDIKEKTINKKVKVKENSISKESKVEDIGFYKSIQDNLQNKLNTDNKKESKSDEKVKSHKQIDKKLRRKKALKNLEKSIFSEDDLLLKDELSDLEFITRMIDNGKFKNMKKLKSYLKYYNLSKQDLTNIYKYFKESAINKTKYKKTIEQIKHKEKIDNNFLSNIVNMFKKSPEKLHNLDLFKRAVDNDMITNDNLIEYIKSFNLTVEESKKANEYFTKYLDKQNKLKIKQSKKNKDKILSSDDEKLKSNLTDYEFIIRMIDENKFDTTDILKEYLKDYKFSNKELKDIYSHFKQVNISRSTRDKYIKEIEIEESKKTGFLNKINKLIRTKSKDLNNLDLFKRMVDNNLIGNDNIVNRMDELNLTIDEMKEANKYYDEHIKKQKERKDVKSPNNLSKEDLELKNHLSDIDFLKRMIDTGKFTNEKDIREYTKNINLNKKDFYEVLKYLKNHKIYKTNYDKLIKDTVSKEEEEWRKHSLLYRIFMFKKKNINELSNLDKFKRMVDDGLVNDENILSKIEPLKLTSKEVDKAKEYYNKYLIKKAKKEKKKIKQFEKSRAKFERQISKEDLEARDSLTEYEYIERLIDKDIIKNKNDLKVYKELYDISEDSYNKGLKYLRKDKLESSNFEKDIKDLNKVENEKISKKSFLYKIFFGLKNPKELSNIDLFKKMVDDNLITDENILQKVETLKLTDDELDKAIEYYHDSKQGNKSFFDSITPKKEKKPLTNKEFLKDMIDNGIITETNELVDHSKMFPVDKEELKELILYLNKKYKKKPKEEKKEEEKKDTKETITKSEKLEFIKSLLNKNNVSISEILTTAQVMGLTVKDVEDLIKNDKIEKETKKEEEVKEVKEGLLKSIYNKMFSRDEKKDVKDNKKESKDNKEDIKDESKDNETNKKDSSDVQVVYKSIIDYFDSKKDEDIEKTKEEEVNDKTLYDKFNFLKNLIKIDKLTIPDVIKTGLSLGLPFSKLRDLIRFSRGKKIIGDNDGDGIRDGSWFDIFKKRKDKKENKSKSNTLLAKTKNFIKDKTPGGSLLWKLLGGIGAIGGTMFGGAKLLGNIFSFITKPFKGLLWDVLTGVFKKFKITSLLSGLWKTVSGLFTFSTGVGKFMGKVLDFIGIPKFMKSWFNKILKFGVTSAVATTAATKVYDEVHDKTLDENKFSEKEKEAYMLAVEMHKKGYEIPEIEEYVNKEYGVDLEKIIQKQKENEETESSNKPLLALGAAGGAYLVTKHAVKKTSKALDHKVAEIKKATKKSSFLSKVTKMVPKFLKNRWGKGLLKKLPFVGTVASLGSAAYNIYEGNYKEAAIDTLMAVTSSNPLTAALSLASLFMGSDDEEDKKEEKKKITKDIETKTADKNRSKSKSIANRFFANHFIDDKNLSKTFKSKYASQIYAYRLEASKHPELYADKKLILDQESGILKLVHINNPIKGIALTSPDEIDRTDYIYKSYVRRNHRTYSLINKNEGDLCGLKFVQHNFTELKRHLNNRKIKPKYIVLHSTGSNNLSFGRMKKKPFFGTQLWIDRDGTIHKVNELDDYQQHVGRVDKITYVRNYNSIGIEMVQGYKNSKWTPLTDKQKDSLKRVVSCLFGKFNLDQSSLYYHGGLTTRKHPDEGIEAYHYLKGITFVTSKDEIKVDKNNPVNRAMFKSPIKNTHVSDKSDDSYLDTQNMSAPTINDFKKSDKIHPSKNGVKINVDIPNKLKPLLDIMSKGENGGISYDAIYGGSKYIKDVKPTELTIEDIFTLQDKLREKTKNTRLPSSAVGKYQFTKPVLKELVNELHIPKNAKFTPELQDYLFTYKLDKKRGLGQWLRGEIDDVQFANNLSMELASVEGFIKGTGHKSKQRTTPFFKELYPILEYVKNSVNKLAKDNKSLDSKNIVSTINELESSNSPILTDVNASIVTDTILNKSIKSLDITKEIKMPEPNTKIIKHIVKENQEANKHLRTVASLLKDILNENKKVTKKLDDLNKKETKIINETHNHHYDSNKSKKKIDKFHHAEVTDVSSESLMD